MNSISIKIPMKAPAVIITKLRKRGDYSTTGKAYATNRIARDFGFFCVLKAFTTTGTIHNYPQQLELIKAYTHIKATSVINSRIKRCERFGLLKKVGKDLKLIGWQKCLRKLGFTDVKKEEIKFLVYDFKQTTPIATQYLIELAAEDERQIAVKNAVVRKINQNNELKEAFGLKPGQTATHKHADALFEEQCRSFVSDDLTKDEYTLLHSIQACPFRSVKAMINARRNNTTIRATYERIAQLKRKFSTPGLATVEDVTLITNGKARPNQNFWYNGFNHEYKKPLWYLPTSIKSPAYVAQNLIF